MNTIPVFSEEAMNYRKQFFGIIFTQVSSGYVCIARRVPHQGAFEEKFFQWPDQINELSTYIHESVMRYDTWYCPMLFAEPRRAKDTVDMCPGAWADLDTCPPEALLIEPTVLVESSPGKFQALWLLQESLEPVMCETISRRIAYFHAEQGADKSGWDLTQLLRVPLTYNYKYEPPSTVEVIAIGDSQPESQFDIYPVVDEDAKLEYPFPEPGTVEASDVILERFRHDLDPSVWRLIGLPPESDWSKTLWNLEMLLCESDLTKEEVFSIVRDAKCNKYKRDGRSEKLLWREVCKAWVKVRERSAITPDASVHKSPELLSDGDLKAAEQDYTFIEEYIAWGSSVGDAAVAYHQAGAFVCLAGLLAGILRLPTSFGPVVPNLWFLLLADTTLTRKSTALDLAMDMLVEIDSDIILATDGSIEGLFGSLATRPGRPSIFLRDEFSGFMEMMTKRDYYAGMAETLTKLYDGKFQKRQLRHELIEVREPVLILFAGGIKTRTLALINYTHVTSGFLPRFIFITARSDLSRLKPLGPPTNDTTEGRDKLLTRLRDMARRYHRVAEITVGESRVFVPDRPSVSLTPGAWRLYNKMEETLLESGLRDTNQDLLTPTMDRLAKSGLKASLLIAASRMREQVVVDEGDIMKAFQYVGYWREFAMDVISNVGVSKEEHELQLIYGAIKKSPGVQRSYLMRSYHLSKRDADTIFDTLEQRGLVVRTRTGRTERLQALL